MRPCFQFSNVAANDKAPAHLSIEEEIGFWGVQAKDFGAQLRAIKESGQTELIVTINSPGGDVFDGLSMYNGLRASGLKITTKAMGLVASAATLPFLAGDVRQMPKNTHIMVHNPMTMAYGNEDDMREAADILAKIGRSVASTYSARTGLSDEKVTELRSKDTWMNADESKDLGFATEVIEEVKAQAKFDIARMELPAHVAAVFMKAPDKKPEPKADPEPTVSASLIEQITAAADTAGLKDLAPVFALSCKDFAAAEKRIAVAREIKSLCVLLKKPDAVTQFVKDEKSLDQVRESLAKDAAAEDEANPTSQIPPAKGDPTKPQVAEATKAWKEFRARKNGSTKASK